MKTGLIYPRYPVTAGVVVAGVLLMVGVGAILSLIVAPQSISPQDLWAALDVQRLGYSLKSAGVQASLSVFFSIVIAIPAAITVARRPTMVRDAGAGHGDQPGHGAAHHRSRHGVVGGLGAQWHGRQPLWVSLRGYEDLRDARGGVGAYDAECAAGDAGNDPVIECCASNKMAPCRPPPHDGVAKVSAYRMAGHPRRDPGAGQFDLYVVLYVLCLGVDVGRGA